MKGLSFKIYKLETENPLLKNVNFSDVPQLIIDEYNKQKEETVYDKLSTRNTFNKKGLDFIFFKKVRGLDRLPHIWKQYFESGESGVEFGEIKSENHHILSFILNHTNQEVYCISTGAAYVVFEKFVDYDFPLSIARKIVNPEVKSADTKGLTGALMASSLQFRRPRRIASIEGAGNIWTQISGYLRDEILNDDSFKDIFGDKPKVSVEIKGSVKFGPKLSSIDRLVDLIIWLESVDSEYPDPPGDDFAFLDAVKKIDRRKHPDLVKELEAELNTLLGKSEYDNFDLCHQETSRYLNSESYSVKFGGKEESYEENPFLENFENFVSPLSIESLEKIHIEAKYEEPFLNVEGSVYDVLCGEISSNDHAYFLFNKHWYSLKPDFLKLVDQSFEGIVTNPGYKANLTFPEWNIVQKGKQSVPEKESDYNKKVVEKITNTILGDRVFVENIELFDVLTWDDNNLYVVHIKSGFNVKIRDLSSQIFSSAQIIENSRISGFKELEQHHQALVDRGMTTIQLPEYKNLFKKQIHYVLAYGRKQQVIDRNIQSNVAKLELVQLQRDMTRFDGGFKILWISQQ